jgi:hypothetical protein
MAVGCLLLAGCAATGRSAARSGSAFSEAVGRECLVILRGDVVGGAAGSDSEDSDLPVPYFYGRVRAVDAHWLVLRSASGFDYFIPREAILIASVAKK